MRALVVYESMYGNTHVIADAIAEGIRPTGDVRVVPVADVAPEIVVWADLVIVGGPTHAHGMSTSGSRQSAVDSAAKPDGWSQVSLDPTAGGLGIREWIDSLGDAAGKPAAAFDTRAKGPAILTGRASSGIGKGLRGHGFRLLVDPESFLVDTHQRLIGGEKERATAWGASLAARVSNVAPVGPH
jgi:hypothetical protein